MSSNPNLTGYWRLGDTPGSYQVLDSSGNGMTGSLITGGGGTPAYGYAGLMLFDPTTSLDLTAGTNVLNGGFQTVDLSQQPPVQHQPLGSASAWTVEMWLKWTSTANTTPGATIVVTGTIESSFLSTIFQVSSLTGLAVGDGITGPNIPTNTTITAFGPGTDGNQITISRAASGAVSGSFSITAGAVGSTIFSASDVPGLGTSGLDIRVGAATTASVTAYNRITAGPFATDGAYSPVAVSSGTTNVQDGNWHYLAVNYSASVASFYIDGAFDSSWNTGASWANPQSITIGCDDGPINGWVGAMQDVALYSAPLTASQIANHYETGMWFQLAEYGASVGSTTSGRLNKLMAVEGLNSSQMLNVPYPFRTLMYSETNSVTTTSGLNYLQTMSETEPGLIFQAPNGQINAYSRQYQYLAPVASVSQGVFGDSASVGLHYDGPSFQLVQDDLDVWNNIQVQSGRSGSQLQQANAAQFPLAAQSASVYGSRTLQGLTSLQFENDSDALAVAENYLQWYANPVKRVVGISINSWGNNGNNIPQMLQRGLYDRITIQYQGQTPGPQFSQDSLIESISHSVSMTGGGTWATTYQMSPYEILLTPFIFGNAAQSQLAGAASVTGSGTSTVTIHTGTNFYLSGNVVMLVNSTISATIPYNATQGQIEVALANAGITPASVTGQFNTNSTVAIGFFTSTTLTAQFIPSCSLTL